MRRAALRLGVRVALACLVAAVLSGCRLDAVVEVALDRDGGGELIVELAADRALVTRAAASGVDPLDMVAERMRETPGWSVDVTDAGAGGRRLRIAAGFADAERFDALMSEFVAALEAPELVPLESLRLERDGDRVRVAGAASLRPSAEVAELGFTPDSAVEGLARAVTYRIRVRVPGEVLDTNADRSADGVLEWVVPAGERVEILAVGVLPGARVLPLIAGGALVAVLSALWLRRRGA